MISLRKNQPSGGSALYTCDFQAFTRRSLVAGEPFESAPGVGSFGDGKRQLAQQDARPGDELAQRTLVTGLNGINTSAYGFRIDLEPALVSPWRKNPRARRVSAIKPYKRTLPRLSFDALPTREFTRSHWVGKGISAIAGRHLPLRGKCRGGSPVSNILRYIPREVDATSVPNSTVRSQ